MRKGRLAVQRNGSILNPRLLAAIAALGHGEVIMVVGPDLAVPFGVEVLDLSLVPGVPAFSRTLAAVVAELQLESAALDTETWTHDPKMAAEMQGLLEGIPTTFVDSVTLSAMGANARLVVRTGETAPYAVAVLVGGVTF